MAIFGQGIAPPPGAVATELTNVVRRAFLRKVYIQIYNSAPLISALISSAQVASGGLAPITAPVQGTSMVQLQAVGYDGSFNQPGNIPAIDNAEFALKAYVAAIPFLGMEGLVQVDYSIVPLIEARMNDAANVMQQGFSNDLYNNIGNTQRIVGLQAAIDDGTFAATYGGLSRTAKPFWRSTYVHNAGPVAPTRNLMLQYIAQVTKKTGEMPKMGVCNFGLWTLLAQDFLPQERYVIAPGDGFGTGKVQSLFRALDIAGVPIYADAYCPEGTLYLLNPDYLSLFIHEKASFYFTGFESLLPNAQFGYLGAILTLLELVNVKPVAHGKFDNLSFLPI